MSPRPSQAVRPALRPVPPQGLSFAFPLRLPESGTGAGGEKPGNGVSRQPGNPSGRPAR